LAVVLSGCAGMPSGTPAASILVHLDPASTERTYIIENITADIAGVFYTSDQVTGNALRVDPKSPEPVVVAKVESRSVDGRMVDALPSGSAFDAKGDFYLAADPIREVVRIRATDLNPAKSGMAQTFATSVSGANGMAL